LDLDARYGDYGWLPGWLNKVYQSRMDLRNDVRATWLSPMFASFLFLLFFPIFFAFLHTSKHSSPSFCLTPFRGHAHLLPASSLFKSKWDVHLGMPI
jgi:hypothetical protein